MRYTFIKFLVILLMPFSTLAFSDTFDRNVEDLLYEQLEDKKMMLEISYDLIDKISQIKSRQNEIKDILLVNHEPHRASFKVRVNYMNGSSDEIFGHYDAYVELPVTSRFIKTGEIILAGDITTIKTKTSRIRGNYITSDVDIIGMQAKKHLSPGTMIKANELARSPVIKMNDPVNITYSSGTINLKTSGISLGVGAIGDMIKVKNEDTGTVILGQIINKNTVQVSGE